MIKDTQGMNWSVEHAQTKTVTVQLCDGRISSQRLGDSSSRSSRGVNWSVEHAQTKTVKVKLCDGRVSSQRLGDSSSSSSSGASEQ